MRRGVLSSAVVAAALLAGVSSASALPNGGFGSGNLSKWNHYGSVCPMAAPASAGARSATQGRGGGGSSDFAIWDHFANPFVDSESSTSVPAPIGGHGVVFLQSAPSVGVLNRTFRIPRRARQIKFRLWWNNQAISSPGSAPRGLAPPLWVAATSLNCPLSPDFQFIYVDLLKPNAPITSLAKKYRLKRLWVPTPFRTPATNGGFQKFSRSVKSLRGKRVKFRLAVIDTMGYLTVGFDELRIR